MLVLALDCLHERTVSSAVERFVDIEEAYGSNPYVRTRRGGQVEEAIGSSPIPSTHEKFS